MVFGLAPDQPIVKFSEKEERASLIEEEEEEPSMSRKKGGKRKKSAAKKSLKGTKGLKFSNGRLALKLSGYGHQTLGASELVKYIPLSKLKQAAKKVLRGKGTPRTQKRKSKKRKS